MEREVVLEPFEVLMTIMEMGVKGGGEAESWLGKATEVESEISGTSEKTRVGGKPERARQEHRARREKRKGKHTRSVTEG